jgi:hypothetical protein
MPAPPSPPLTQTARALGLAAALAALALHVEGTAALWLTWADRDLARAGGFDGGLATMGAEIQLGDGVRVPGAAYALLLGAPLPFTHDPLTVWRWVAALESVALAVFVAAVHRAEGALAAGLAAGLLATLGGWTDGVFILWNPALLPLFVVGAWALFLRMADAREARALPAWAACVAVGAQLHLSVLPIAGLMLVALAALRVRGLLRAAPAALAVIALAYAPYLLDEAQRGWPNTTALLHPTGAPAGDRMATNLPRLAAYLAPTALPGAPAWAAFTPWLGLLGLARAGSTPRVAALISLLGAASIAANPALDLRPDGTGRYVMALAPGWAFALAVGWARLPPAAALLPAAAAALGAAGAWAEASKPNHRHLGAYTALLAEVTKSTGTPLGDWTRAAVLLRPEPDGRWAWKGGDPVDWMLYAAGDRPRGAAPPPCIAVRVGASPDGPPWTEDDLRRTLGRPLPALRLLDRAWLPGGHELVRYDPGELRCASSFGTRYVRTEAERAVEATRDALRDGEALRSTLPDGGERAIVWLPSHRPHADPVSGRFGLAVDLTPLGGAAATSATLHAHALRGRSWTSGSQLAAFATDVALRFTPLDGGAPWTVPLADAPVGPDGALTPLQTTSHVPTPSAVDLLLTVRGGLVEADPPGTPATLHPVEVRLFDRYAQERP